MSDKPARRRKPARRPEPEEFAGDGLVMRFAENVFENPAMSGGLLVMAITAAAIVSNAMFLQSTRHPDPLFMTRPSPALEMPKHAAVPMPRPRLDPVEAPPVPAPVAAAPAPETVGDPLTVAKVQRALAGRGFYRGTVDGVAGARTRAAIAAYQKAEGMPVSGAPSIELLDHLRTAAVKPIAIPPRPAKALPPAKLPPAPIPAPAAQLQPAPADPIGAVAAAPAAPATDPIATVAAVEPAAADPIAAVAAPPTATALPDPIPVAAPAAPVVAAPAQPDPAAIQHQRYASVQNALNQMGYGPVPTDGTLNEETVNAIRRFELDNGLPITGKIGNRLTDRLVSIGAMKGT